MAEFDMFDVDEGDVDTFAMPPVNGSNWPMNLATSVKPPPPASPDGTDLGASGVALNLPLLFTVESPVNISALAIAVRYVRDPATYVIYETDGFAVDYAPDSTISGMGTQRVQFSVKEFGGWRSRLLQVLVFGIDTDDVLLPFDVLAIAQAAL